MLSVHTSPLDQPGTGDAGGLNVYVTQLATKLAQRGVDVEIFTRATSGATPPTVELAPGVLVRHVVAGPFGGISKAELPSLLCPFTRELLRAEDRSAPGRFDVVHSHYWLSGQVGALVAERWGVPFVHTMHTMAKVKNAALAAGDRPEPRVREIGEEQVVAAADLLLANTAEEAGQLLRYYGADPARVRTVHPGVDLSTFSPGDRRAARAALGLPADALVLLFAGRIQPLKGPDLLVRAAAELLAREPGLRGRLVLAFVGGPSGTGTEHPRSLARLTRRLGVADLTRFHPAVDQRRLATWYRAASLVVVPSRSESFGLVALEAAACGTPVVAAAVGGLPTVVAGGTSGVLVGGYDPGDWAEAIRRLAADPVRLAAMGRAAATRARGFGWAATADAVLAAYGSVLGPATAGSSRAVGE